MRVSIDEGEWYPMYSTSVIDDGDPYSVWFDVPDSIVERWLKIDEQFMIMQQEVGKLYRDRESQEEKAIGQTL